MISGLWEQQQGGTHPSEWEEWGQGHFRDSEEVFYNGAYGGRLPL